jgi:hypothetical protein
VTDTQVKLSGRILDDEIGVRSDDADELYKLEGKRRMLVGEVESYRFAHDLDGAPIVTVRLTSLELVPPGDGEDFAREWQRAIYTERSPKPLDGDLQAESVKDATARGRAKLLCETCLHQRTDDRIAHDPNPDADGAFCTWKDSGEEVKAGDEPDEETPDGEA